MASAVLLFAAWQDRRPDRVELGPRVAWLRFTPVALDAQAFGPLQLAGAWQVTSNDPRVGGISALALSDGQMIALSDAGAVIRFPKPSNGLVPASVSELPDGPGPRGFKFNRDSEALAADPAGRGWWVAFENRNAVWLYDRDFRRVLARMPLRQPGLERNRGIEGATAFRGALLLAPEDGRSLIVAAADRRSLPIGNPAGRISELAVLPSGKLLAINRRATGWGFVNSLAWLSCEPSACSYRQRMPLGVGKLDNVEAVAPELLPTGRVRLWLMTDDNHQRPLRTLLIAVDLPPG